MYPRIKRLFDAVVAAVLLLLCLPLMALMALALRQTQPGGALFCQRRVGKDGKLFVIWKFCTLNSQSGETTRLGAWLRLWSVDELPQLWNILVGEMSFVGPRPVVPEETTLLRYRRQFGATGVRPGLTGLAQVRGRKSLDAEDKARCDAYYCKELCFSLDVYILWRTLFCLRSCEPNTNKKPLTNGG